MSYVDDNLNKGEKVLFRAHVSKVSFLAPVLCVLPVIFGIAEMSANNGTYFALFWFLFTAFFALYTVYTLIVVIVRLATTEFAVTNRRIIAKTSFIRRHTMEILLGKVESVQVSQSIMERFLDIGTVTITGTGGTQERFRKIANPMGVRKKVNEILEAYQRWVEHKASERQIKNSNN
jgi:uncharacterized membrane protein YdbT with pleckstrin-like domain